MQKGEKSDDNVFDDLLDRGQNSGLQVHDFDGVDLASFCDFINNKGHQEIRIENVKEYTDRNSSGSAEDGSWPAYFEILDCKGSKCFYTTSAYGHGPNSEDEVYFSKLFIL